MDKKDWEYQINLDCVRITKIGSDEKYREGWLWALSRSVPVMDPNGKKTSYTESIVSGCEVFDSQEEAKKDALEKLSVLRCPIDKPIDRALKWMLDALPV